MSREGKLGVQNNPQRAPMAALPPRAHPHVWGGHVGGPCGGAVWGGRVGGPCEGAVSLLRLGVVSGPFEQSLCHISISDPYQSDETPTVGRSVGWGRAGEA